MKRKTENISLFRYIFYGINSVVGLTFLIGFGAIFRGSGNLLFLLFGISAIIAFIIGWFYGYLSKHLKNIKGGIYTYTKYSFGSRWAFFFNWCQYIYSPILLAGETMAVLLGFSTLSWYSEYRGWIILTSGLLFVILSFLLTFGFRSTRIIIAVLTCIAIFNMLFFTITCLTVIGKGFFNNFVSGIPKQHNAITLTTLITAFFAFFFSVGGIEYLAAGAHDVKDKEKTLKGILIVVFISIIGHFLFSAVTKGALNNQQLAKSSTNSGQNPINLVYLTVFGTSIGTIIVYFNAISNLLIESNARLTNGWLSVRVVESMADDGFFPTKWGRRNKNAHLQIGVAWHSLITLFFISSILIPLYFFPKANHTINAPFQIYTFVAFIQYIGVAGAIFTLMRRKIISKQRFLYHASYIIVVTLFSLLILYIYSALNNALNGDESQWISLGSSFGILSISQIIYLFRNKEPKYIARRKQTLPTLIKNINT